MGTTETKRTAAYRALAAWAAEHGSVRVRDVVVALGGTAVEASGQRNGAWSYLAKLVRDLAGAGHVREAGRAAPSGAWGSDKVYELTELGAEWARRAAGGAVPAVVCDPPTWYGQLWQSARIMRRFTVRDLLPTIDPEERVTRDRAYRYVRRLVEAGAVRVDGRTGPPGQRGAEAVYRVLRFDVAPPVALGANARRRANYRAGGGPGTAGGGGADG